MAHDAGNNLNIESKVTFAMSSRVTYFREQADSLTFEGVRRLLEKDLGLDTLALDVHKRFVKKCLKELMEADNRDQVSKSAGDDEEKAVSSGAGGAELVDGLELKKELKEPASADMNKMENSPVMGLLAGNSEIKSEAADGTRLADKIVPDEIMIKKAVKNRASHFRAHSENITYSGARRLLEEDLKLMERALDPCKKFIHEQVDEVLKTPAVDKKSDQRKISNKSREEESPGSDVDVDVNTDEEEEEEEEDTKSRKNDVAKRKRPSVEGRKKRKMTEEVTKGSRRKQVKASKIQSVKDSDADDNREASDDVNSGSSGEKHVKKKQIPKPAYGKRVEHLRSVIKSCGMSIPPVIYKKVKQHPEVKREAALIKELEEILAKEGLSSNPTEKEIKEVKRKKERDKELEGIDMSNIVSSSRRRSTASYAPPPKPKLPVESDESGDEDEEEEDEEEQEEAEGGNDSQSGEDNESGDSDLVCLCASFVGTPRSGTS